MNRKCLPTDEDNEDLSTNNNGLDAHEPSVAKNPVQDVKTVVQTARANEKSANNPLPTVARLHYLLPLVKDLHPDECVKHHGLKLILLAICRIPKNGHPSKV